MEVYDYIWNYWNWVYHINYSEIYCIIREGQLGQSRPAGCPRYAIPCNAPGVLQIMCHSDEVKMIPIDMAPWHTPEVPIQRPSRSRGSHGSFVLRWVGPKLMKCHESCVFLVGAARRRLWKLAPVDSDTVVLTATVPSLEGWIVQSSTCPCSTRPPPKAWI